MKINPIAFSIFGIDIRWYGILIAIGAFLAIYFGEKLVAKKNFVDGMYKSVITDLAFFVIIFGIIGARAYYVIFEWDYYKLHTNEILAIRNGGLAIYGGIIAGIIVGVLFCKIKKINFLSLADCVFPGVALAQSIGRWGNFINGEAHGGPTDLPWAILVNGQRVHPTFLYESVIDFSIFLFLYLFLSRRQKFKGQNFSIYLILYGIGRFFVESMRTDSLYIGIFRVSQLVSLVAILIGIIIYIFISKKFPIKKDAF